MSKSCTPSVRPGRLCSQTPPDSQTYLASPFLCSVDIVNKWQEKLFGASIPINNGNPHQAGGAQGRRRPAWPWSGARAQLVLPSQLGFFRLQGSANNVALLSGRKSFPQGSCRKLANSEHVAWCLGRREFSVSYLLTLCLSVTVGLCQCFDVSSLIIITVSLSSLNYQKSLEMWHFI